MPLDLNQMNDDARASESDREYLESVKDTKSGGVDPDESDDGVDPKKKDGCALKGIFLIVGILSGVAVFLEILKQIL